MTDKAKELADNMDVDYFNRLLQDQVRDFNNLIAKKKKMLSKGELFQLSKALVNYPDTSGILKTENLKDLLELGCAAKESYLALTVQMLIEQGQKVQESKNKFVPEGESNE